MAARRNRRFNLRLSQAEFDNLNNYADKHGTTASELLRGYIHQLTNPHSQPPLPGTQVIPLDGGRRQAQSRQCTGRKSDPDYVCKNPAFKDFDRCRGCALADREIDARERASALKTARGVKRY